MAILRSYVKRIWYDATAEPVLHLCPKDPPGVPFSQAELASALQKAPIVKAVAAPFPPNLMWRINAEQIAAIIYADLQRWWTQWPPHVPAVWQRGWLVFIGKPNKPPNAPENVRALAMQEPAGKAILQILTAKLQAATFDTLCRFPQMQSRDTQDALIRVVHRCNQVKSLLKTQATNLRNDRQRTSKLQCYGGIQMFVDLEKAFDMAPRAAVIKAMQRLQVPPSLISFFAAWHSDTSYVITHHQLEDIQTTTRGVRQGCVAAPQLWLCLMYQLMIDYSSLVPLPWLLDHLTIFADDVHLCQLIRDATDLQMAIDRFGLFIQCAHDLGSKINFQKTEILLRLAGHFHSHVQSKHIQRTATGVFLRIPYGHGQVAHIPLKTQVTYLGVCITYQNFQKATLDHRIAAGRHIFRRLKVWLSRSSKIPVQKRFQLWQTTVFAAMTYGIFTIGLVLQGLQTLQSEIMRQLRIISGNFSQQTAMSHFEFLQHFCWPSPARLLLRRVEGMIARTHQRLYDLTSDDIVLLHRWTHLSDLAHLLHQAMETEPTAQALHSALHPTTYHACFFCDRAFHSVRAHKMHMWMDHQYSFKHFRPVDLTVDTSGNLPYCKTWTLFRKHMALHIDTDVTQVTAAELAQHLAVAGETAPMPDPVLNLQSQPSGANPSSAAPAQFCRSALFDKARNTTVGARALALIHAHDWTAIKADDEVKQWLSTHCVVCNIEVGGLKRMNMHMRQNHQQFIDGLYQTAGTVLRRCGTASPCEFCQKEFQIEHLCPAIIQASMVLLHELPIAAEPPPQAAVNALDSKRTRRLIVHTFALARDSIEGNPQCSHCRRSFDTLNGLKMHITLGKCPQFDTNRSCTPVDPDPNMLQHLRDGTLMIWLADAFLRMQWTCHCKTCGLKYTGAAGLANHLQTAHSALWHAATTCTSFLSAYVHTIHRCVCNPFPGHMRNEHQCLILRQIAMQYVRARDAGDFPSLFLPYRIDEAEFRAILPYAPVDFCDLLHAVITTQQMAPLWNSPFLRLLNRQCLICGHEATGWPLSEHLIAEHGLALNSAMMLHANFAAMAFGYFQCCASQPTSPLCAAPCAEMTVQQHLATCPVVHQLAWTFSNPCHGRKSGVTPPCSVGGRVPSHGTAVGQTDHEDPGTGDGAERCPTDEKGQGPHQWKRQSQGQEQGESKRRRSGAGNRGQNARKTGPQVGPSNASAKPQLLPDLFYQQSRRKHTEESDPHHLSVEADGRPKLGYDESAERLVADHDEVPSATCPAAGRSPGHRSDGHSGQESWTPSCRSILALSGMEQAHSKNDADQSNAKEDGCDAEVHCRPGGEQPRSSLGAELSHNAATPFRSTALQSSGSAGVSMAHGHEPSRRRQLESSTTVAGECHLEPPGGPIQAGDHETKRLDTTAGDATACPELISFLEKGDMLIMMTQMRLQNVANFCYCNATMFGLWWALLSRHATALGIGARARMICKDSLAA
eukprot:s848_g9.t1